MIYDELALMFDNLVDNGLGAFGPETGGVNTTTYWSSSEVACDYSSLVECDGPLDTVSTWDVAWGTEDGSGAGDFLNTRGSVNLVRCARSAGGDM